MIGGRTPNYPHDNREQLRQAIGRRRRILLKVLSKWLSILVLALIVAGLIVPNPVLDPTPVAEAGRAKDGMDRGGVLELEGKQPDRLKHVQFDGSSELTVLNEPATPQMGDAKQLQRDMRVTGTCGTIDFRMGAVPKEELGTALNGVTWVIVVESTLGPVAYAQYQITFSREDQDDNGNPIKYPDTRTGWVQNYPPFPNYAVVLPQGFAATGDGKVVGNLEGNSLIYLGGDPAQQANCTWRDNWEVAFPGYRKSNDPRDPSSGFGDLFPPTGDTTVNTSKFPDPDNKHCEACDKDYDAAQEDAMFRTRDKACDPNRYESFGRLSYKACHHSGLLAIRASESNTANSWTRWLDANKNGWRSPGDFTQNSTVEGYTFSKLGNIQQAWVCMTCSPQRAHIPIQYSAYGPINGNRPPPDNSGWKPNPARQPADGAYFPALCDYEPTALYGCSGGFYAGASKRPPAEDGSNGGTPSWTPSKVRRAQLRFGGLVSDIEDEMWNDTMIDRAFAR